MIFLLFIKAAKVKQPGEIQTRSYHSSRSGSMGEKNTFLSDAPAASVRDGVTLPHSDLILNEAPQKKKKKTHESLPKNLYLLPPFQQLKHNCGTRR